MRVLVLTTGGTIDKIYFDAKSEFEVGKSMVGELLRQAHVDVDVTVTEVLRKDLKDHSDLGEYGAAAIHRTLLDQGCTTPPSERTIGRYFNTGAGFNTNSAQQLASNYRTFPSMFIL